MGKKKNKPKKDKKKPKPAKQKVSDSKSTDSEKSSSVSTPNTKSSESGNESKKQELLLDDDSSEDKAKSPSKHVPVDHPRYGKLLAGTMAITLLWGVVWVLIGVAVRDSFGRVIQVFTEKLAEEVHLESAINLQEQNICPVLAEDDSSVYIGDWSRSIGSAVFLAGLVVIFTSLIGVFAGVVSNKPLLVLVILALCVFIVCQIYIIYIGWDSYASFHENIREELLSKVSTDYTVEYERNTFTPAMNTIMLWFECCGIESVKDFGNLTFVENLGVNKTREYEFLVPPSCCKRELFNGDPGPASYLLLKQCAIDGYKKIGFINEKGCYEAVYHALFIKLGAGVTTIHAVIIAWNVMQIIIAILDLVLTRGKGAAEQALARQEREASRKGTGNKEGAASGKDRAGTDPDITRFSDSSIMSESRRSTRFKPFAKVSSFIHSDIYRIKSTEIW